VPEHLAAGVASRGDYFAPAPSAHSELVAKGINKIHSAAMLRAIEVFAG
jgi:hypothetical protein